MTTFYIGGDVSKGYADFAILDESGRILREVRFDDNRSGHDALEAMIDTLAAGSDDTKFVVGVEATGGYERNWLATLRAGSRAPQITTFRLNPLAVRRLAEVEPRRTKTDRTSARHIANYLRLMRCRPEAVEDPLLRGKLNVYRAVCAAIERHAEVQNELQSLLPRVQPELVKFCRQGMPAWLLALLGRYPTAPQLAAATVDEIKGIPYVTATRARRVSAAAATSVAAERDPETGATVVFLTQQLVTLAAQIEDMRKAIRKSMAEDPAVKILATIPGIGLWTAICLRLEIGDVKRFYSAKALIAFAGLDPIVNESGDVTHPSRISRRGRARIRKVLYLAALAAIRCYPPVRAFYERLRARGKRRQVGVVAAMAKLLRIAYACLIKEQPFDPDFSGAPTIPVVAATTNKRGRLQRFDAPISRREAKRREAAATPQVPDSGQLDRGQTTASSTVHSAKENNCATPRAVPQ